MTGEVSAGFDQKQGRLASPAFLFVSRKFKERSHLTGSMRHRQRHVRGRRSMFLACATALLPLVAVSGLHAQAQYPPEALLNATSAQAAANALGAAKPELSGYLLIDAPDIVLPGKVRIVAESQLPGTSQIVLLRSSRRPIGNAAQPEKVLVAAAQVPPGERAQLKVDVDAASTLDLVLLAQFRGQWFYAARQVKVGTPAD